MMPNRFKLRTDHPLPDSIVELLAKGKGRHTLSPPRGLLPLNSFLAMLRPLFNAAWAGS